MPGPLLHEEAVDGGTEKDMPISQSPPDVCQWIADVATCSLEPTVPEEPLPQDDLPGLVTGGVGRWEMSLRLIRLPQTMGRVGNAPTQRILNWVRKQHHLDFLAIMEPMGLDVRYQVLVDLEQLLHVRLKSNKWPKPLFVTAVYAKCDTVERRALWDALRAVSVGASLWIVGSDFNTILSQNKHSGGSAPSGIAMSDFHDAIADSALVDAGYVGSPYTWYSRRLRQRLDRALISGCWMTVFPKMQVAHIELSQSDHRGLLVEVECTVERKVSSFRFQHMWTTHSEFLGVVRRNWQYPTVGNGMMRLQQKLTRLRHCLKEWNKTVFGNVFDNVATTERGLKEADEAYDQDPCNRTLVERNRCSAELVRVLAQEETFWRQKAGIRWVPLFGTEAAIPRYHFWDPA
ncbi:UNVERIFIED_CONTAM: hypothetical protein Sradi_0864700 [Sesamum radiatum]|uniref:Endonuclease/exonuclease/phosphatase domain-containing protein n=1 Tax=Sesamum radiatum TaxID=300843 RepID=A0AAW2V352_SESRA